MNRLFMSFVEEWLQIGVVDVGRPTFLCEVECQPESETTGGVPCNLLTRHWLLIQPQCVENFICLFLRHEKNLES